VRQNDAFSKRLTNKSIGRSREHGSLHVESSGTIGTGRKQNTIRTVDRQEAEPEPQDFRIGGLCPHSEAVRQEVLSSKVKKDDSRRLPRRLIELQVVQL